MATSEARKRANEKWQTEKVDDLRVRVPKGQREIIHDHAAKQGESINGFINRAIREAIERDNSIVFIRESE